MHRTLLLAAVTAPLAAQVDPLLAPFRFELGLGGGRLEHRTDGSNLDGDASAGFFRLAFEGIGEAGIGGGLRLEGVASEDDLFTAAGFVPTEASASSLFGHVTIRIVEGNLRMPMRIGLQAHEYSLTETLSGAEASFASFGPQFELAPELLLDRDDDLAWSVYAQIGFGAAASSIDADGIGNDFDSSSFFYGFDLGVRLYTGHVVLGLGVVVRGQEVDESDAKGSASVAGIENDFEGLVFSVGAIF